MRASPTPSELSYALLHRFRRRRVRNYSGLGDAAVPVAKPLTVAAAAPATVTPAAPVISTQDASVISAALQRQQSAAALLASQQAAAAQVQAQRLANYNQQAAATQAKKQADMVAAENVVTAGLTDQQKAIRTALLTNYNLTTAGTPPPAAVTQNLMDAYSIMQANTVRANGSVGTIQSQQAAANAAAAGTPIASGGTTSSGTSLAAEIALLQQQAAAGDPAAQLELQLMLGDAYQQQVDQAQSGQLPTGIPPALLAIQSPAPAAVAGGFTAWVSQMLSPGGAAAWIASLTTEQKVLYGVGVLGGGWLVFHHRKRKRR